MNKDNHTEWILSNEGKFDQYPNDHELIEVYTAHGIRSFAEYDQGFFWAVLVHRKIQLGISDVVCWKYPTPLPNL